MNNISPRSTTFVEVADFVPRPGVRMILASETFQHTGSFKFRAAYQVARNAPNGHIIAASSGNFGQALALACKVFDKRCTIVMPVTSARVKIDAVGAYGGEVDLIDVAQTSRDDRVGQLSAQYPDAYVTSPFDDPWVIAGNATLGAEILDAYGDVEAMIAPIGGGGLASGLVVAVRDANRDVQVIGAEPQCANDASRSFRAGHLVANEHEPQTIADGARTKSLGKRNWDILRSKGGLTDVIEVPEETICEAVRKLFVKTNLKVEPTGALAVGSVLTQPERFMGGGLICCIVSGGNVDPFVYANILSNAK